MKKKDLSVLASIGIAAGFMVVGCEQRPTTPITTPPQEMGDMSPDLQAFYKSLSPEGQKKFDELDAQHKMMAVEMTRQKKEGENSCAAMGGCKTDEHGCAGKNSCKGEGGAPITDPNKAVDIQHENQLQKK